MIRRIGFLTGLLALAVIPGVALAVAGEENSPSPAVWGGEARLHAGSLNSDEGIGRTGGVFETRLSFDAPVATGIRAFGEAGTGIDQGADEAGLYQLHLTYRFTPSRDMYVRAGWIRMPFGRWDAVTLSRPLIKDHAFNEGTSQEFIMRRASAGLSFHASGGLFEFDAAALDLTPAQDLRIGRENGSDTVERFGIRQGAFSVGVSLLQGVRGGDATSTGVAADPGGVRSQGIDLQWSHGIFSVGGEALVLDIAGERNTGYYVQGTLDASRLVRGLRLLAKHDVFDEAASGANGRFQRETIGCRQSLRRDLDLEVEFNRDRGTGPLPGFGGSHYVVGLRYRF